MTRTTFKNAHGLTEKGHLSTARDMTILGRHVLYDYPQYYNLFSRRSTDAGMRSVANTNSRLLNAYKGADGIKTGYTRAAGFNLVASAERGRERIIATVFGGRSTASRNAKVAELLDLGFKRAPSRVALRTPRKPAYQGNVAVAAAPAPKPAASGTKGKSIRVASAAVKKSLRPQARPVAKPVAEPEVAPLVADVRDDIETVLKTVQNATEAEPVVVASARAPEASAKPVKRPKNVVLASTAARAPATPARKAEVVTRISTSGGRNWGVNLGRFPSSFDAEKVLLKTALAEPNALDGALRKVVRSSRGFDAHFMGLTREGADLACRKLQARQMTCFMVGPG
jgi:D-alanyl-D-alanine carboxypeptidase